MKRVALVSVVAGLALASAAPVSAQDEPPPVREDEPGDAVDSHREGVYGGVDPGAPDANKVTHKDAGAKKTLHWVGFQQENGGSEVFLQAAEPFTVEQRVDGKTLVVSITGLTRLGKNVRRPLDTRFFDGPVVRVVSKPRRARAARRGTPAVKAGIDVVITFRDGTAETADVRTATGADGRFFTYLRFAGGAAPSSP